MDQDHPWNGLVRLTSACADRKYLPTMGCGSQVILNRAPSAGCDREDCVTDPLSMCRILSISVNETPRLKLPHEGEEAAPRARRHRGFHGTPIGVAGESNAQPGGRPRCDS